MFYLGYIIIALENFPLCCGAGFLHGAHCVFLLCWLLLQKVSQSSSDICGKYFWRECFILLWLVLLPFMLFCVCTLIKQIMCCVLGFKFAFIFIPGPNIVTSLHFLDILLFIHCLPFVWDLFGGVMNPAGETQPSLTSDTLQLILMDFQASAFWVCQSFSSQLDRNRERCPNQMPEPLHLMLFNIFTIFCS